MYLIIRYHQPHAAEGEAIFPPEHEWLPSWRIDGPDELRTGAGPTISLTGEARLPILPEGTLLAAGEVYLDLRNPAVGPFVALEGQVAGDGNTYVPQGQLTPEFWNQLVRICARAGALMVDAAKSLGQLDVTLVLEPVLHLPVQDAFAPVEA